MPKRKRVSKQRVNKVLVKNCRTKVTTYWMPLPYDKNDKFILSSVDCLFHPDYYGKQDAVNMLRTL